MTITHGMDVADVRATAAALTREGITIEEARRLIDRKLRQTDWRGDDAEETKSDWSSRHYPNLGRLREALEQLAEALRRQADEQERASDQTGGAGGGFPPFPTLPLPPVPGPLPRLPFPWPGPIGPWFPGPGPLDPWLDWVGDQANQIQEYIVDAAGDIVTGIGDARDAIVDKAHDFTMGVALAGGRLQGQVEHAMAEVGAAGARFGHWLDMTVVDGAIVPWTQDLQDKYTRPFDALLGTLSNPNLTPASVGAGLLTVLGSAYGATVFPLGPDGLLFDQGEPTVGPTSTHPVTGPESVADLFEVVDDSYAEDAVNVIPTVGPDGKTRFLVTIPGTDAPPWDFIGNANGREWSANLWLVATGNSSGMEGAEQATLNAIAEYRAQHPEAIIGDTPEVLLAGHSQGGMIAAYMASDPDFTSQVNVRAVVNAAGAVDGAGIASDVPVASVAHSPRPLDLISDAVTPYGNLKSLVTGASGDVVPRLDFGGWPGTPSNITQIEVASVPGGFITNHVNEGYVSSMRTEEGASQLDRWVDNNGLRQDFFSGNATERISSKFGQNSPIRA